MIDDIVDSIPDDWLQEETHFETINEHRIAYKTFLKNRLLFADEFINEAQHAGE